MNYPEAMDFLTGLTKFGINFGLGRITELLSRLGNPHHRLPVIHVGGTNGKGSTVAMIDAVLRAAGYRVGQFTSPHLHSYAERTKIDGVTISDDKIADLLTRMRPELELMVTEGYEHPTEFEVSTALSLLYFAQEQVDLVVLEVGLGGLIDSTNVIPAPLITVITNVAMDHMDYLGQTTAEIAQVKAGIIKPGVPLVTAADDPEALAVIRERCREVAAPLVIVGRDVTYQVLQVDEQGTVFDLAGEFLGRQWSQLRTALLGEHQVLNAATAVAVLAYLQQTGYTIPAETFYQGLAQVCWPARLEIVRRHPLVVLDGAHNVAGAGALARALPRIFHYRRLILVLGMLADKEREKVVHLLAPLAEKIIITKPNSPRAAGWEELAVIIRQFGKEVLLEPEISRAVAKALELAAADDLVCITGSLYMVADARAELIGERSALQRKSVVRSQNKGTGGEI